MPPTSGNQRRRETQSRGQLAQIADIRLQQLLQVQQDRISALEDQIADLVPTLLRVQSPVNAQGQRVVNASNPVEPKDLVTLEYLRGFVNAVVNAKVNLIPPPAGPASGDNATGASEAPAPPPPPGGGGGGGGGGTGGGPNSCSTTNRIFPNLVSVVIDTRNAHPAAFAASCSNWAFLEFLVAALRGTDPRFGYNCKRGNCGDTSRDAIAYHFGDDDPEGSPNVFVADVIVGHCGPSPQPAWQDVTDYSTLGCGGARWSSGHS